MVTLSYFRAVMKKSYLLCCCLLLSFWGTAQKVFDFNHTCVEAYQDITRLKLVTGAANVQQAREENSNNLIPVLLESYSDFYTLFLNENPAQYQTLFPHFEERLDQLREGPSTSPFYLYSQAIVWMHRAGVSVKFGHFWDAGWDFRRAYLLLKENKKRFPGFSPNDLMFGALQAVIGTVPKGYRWLVNLLGMRASLTEGMRTVRNYTNSNDPWAKTFFNEAAFMYPYLLFFIENKKEEALQFVQQKKLDLVNNHLHAYMAANLALNNKEIALSESIVQNRNKSEDYLRMSVWDFQLGYTRLYHLRLNEARQHFEQFTRNFKGNFYVKDVYQKISWCYYLQGNMKAAEEARLQVIRKGATDADADKKALKDAREQNWPNPLLLKARLLNDGGFHTEAYQLLAGKTEDYFKKPEEQLEFAYRVARIYDDLGRTEEAIRTYQTTIRMGANRKEYFASRAALQLAQIYEARGQKTLAIQYYQQCLDMEDHEYKDSLDQRAKAGIARCKGA